MTDRELIEDLLSALEYHTEQTRPIQFSTVAIEVAREHLHKPIQRKPLTDAQINAFFEGMEPNNGFWLSFARAIEAAHSIKENT